jgi:phage-related protein
MPDAAYTDGMAGKQKELVRLHGEVKSPPFTSLGRQRAGFWRIMYRIDPDVIIVMDVHQKKSNAIPKRVIEACKRRLRDYDAA